MNKNVELAVRCEGLSREYGKITAVENLDLEIPVGTVFGFLGRNGAGKTTTIKMLTGLVHPTRGKAWVAGVETTNGESNARHRFGYLPQDPAFYNWMSPIEYLDYTAGLFEIPFSERKKRIAYVLDVVGLTKDAKRKIGGFSGGMIQRLGIAQAVVHEPSVLFLDEPTSALDPAGRYEVLDMIDKLRGQVTVFLSSHILADVERICDTIGVIHHGKLLFVSNADALMKKYETNAISIRFDPSSPPIEDSFVKSLETCPWIQMTKIENDILRISVSDVETAKREILPMIVEKGLIVDKFEWVRPSLEEIFLQVSGT